MTTMKKTLMNSKRGIFFTSIAILIAAVLIITFGTQRTVTMKDKLPATQAKAEAVNTQVRDLRNSYLPQSLYIATYSAFFAMAEYMRQRGNYFTGADASLKFNNTLKEMVINGTMCCGLVGHTPCNSDVLADVNNPSIHEGVDLCLGQQVMRGRNLTRRLQDMENASLKAFGINTSFGKNHNAMRLAIFQDNRTGPWQIGANLTVNYSVVAGDVMVNNTENISVIFGIQGIPDPLYAVGSQAAPEDVPVTTYTNYFNATNVTNWNISTFYRQVDWRVYRYEANASSFLDRFYGSDVRSPCCGVESLINPHVMMTVNGMRERSYVDWCYYGSGNRCTAAQTGALWNVTCVTKDADTPLPQFYRFAVDSYHAGKYNLTNDQKDYLYGVGPPPDCPEDPDPS